MNSHSPKTLAQRQPGLPRYERNILLGSIAIAAPGLLTGALAASDFNLSSATLWLIWLISLSISALLLRWQYRRLMFPLYTVSSLLDALREGDYSMRGTGNSALAELIYDCNAVAQQIQNERIQFEEATHLLSKTLSALDSAVFTFDDQQCLRLANPAGQGLLVAHGERLFGMSATELGLAQWLEDSTTRVVSHVFPQSSGRFEVRHTLLRSGGHRGHLLVISDVSRVLREEERQAWQNLLRVLGHEINNSLAPIRSMAGTLSTLVKREPLPDDWREDFFSGLDVIGHRATSLERFLSSYSKLARLPPPRKSAVNLYELAEKLVRLEQRLPIELKSTSPITVQADPDQLAQALINLLHNAVEAVQEQGAGGVRLSWRCEAERVLIEVEDDGPGPPKTDNLFIPFFTNKSGGAGIGLALARHIAEGHEGGVSLNARSDATGALACIWLPLLANARQPEARSAGA